MASKNLKINLTADTSAFASGMKRAKQDLRSLESTSSEVLGGIGSALGLNTGKLQEMGQAARALGSQLTSVGSTGAKAFGAMLSSINTVKLGLAGLGVAAVTAAFRGLNAEAENFKNTIAGANIEMATSAYIETYKQVLHDYSSDTGKAVAETESKWKKFWGTIGAAMKTAFATGATAIDTNAILIGDMNTPSDEFIRRTEHAAAAARTAEQISNDLYELDLKRLKLNETNAGVNAQIRSLQVDIADKSLTTAQRKKALSDAEELIKTKYRDELALEKQRLALMEKQVGLASNSLETEKQLSAQRVKVTNLEEQQSSELKGLIRYHNSIYGTTKNTTKELTVQEQITESLLKDVEGIYRAQSMRQLDFINQLAAENVGAKLEKIDISQFGGAKIEVPATIKFDRKDVQVQLFDISQDIANTISDMVSSVSASIGTLVGDLINGEQAGAHFGEALLDTLGSLAISVGNIAIGIGAAALNIQKALVNPQGAIVAGAALVALGGLLKATLANAASGGAVASSSGSTASSVVYNNDAYGEKTIEVEVTGTLVASGTQLQAVIENTNNRKQHTT